MTRGHLKRISIVFLFLWLGLGTVSYMFYPAILTGSRLLDAILISAIVSALASELLEVAVGAILLLFRKPSKGAG